MEDEVPQEVKRTRLKIIEELQEEIVTEINHRIKGQTVEVLVEGRRRGKWFGRNRNDKLVFLDHQEDQTGELVDVMIDETGPWSLRGTLAAQAAGVPGGSSRRP